MTTNAVAYSTGNSEEPGNEPYPLVFAFFALFEVNLDDVAPRMPPDPVFGLRKE
jgi:hypothetical protein